MLSFLQKIKAINVNAYDNFNVVEKWMLRKEITRYFVESQLVA